MQDNKFKQELLAQLNEAGDTANGGLSAEISQSSFDNQVASPATIERRQFFKKAGGAVAATIVGVTALKSAQAQDNGYLKSGKLTTEAAPGLTGQERSGGRNLIGTERANRALQIRVEAALRERAVPIPNHPDNDDEERYRNQNYFGNFSKGLRHNPVTGEVDPQAYRAFLAAIESEQFSAFESLAPFLGCSDPALQRPFVNPLSGNGFDLEGTDPAQLSIIENGARRPFRPAPAFASAEEAGEMVELYWMSLLRDVPFDQYRTNPTAIAAANDLSNMTDFRGPKINGRVTPKTLFRDTYPGCTKGPYISQFMIRGTSNNIPGVPDVPNGISFGAQRIDLRIRSYAANTDYMTNFNDWLNIQNGCVPSLGIPLDNLGLTYLRDGRGMGQYVRLDVLYQAYFVAALSLIDGVTLNETTTPFIFHFPFDTNNPYGTNGSTLVQAGFGQFGNPHLMTLVTEPSTRALKAIWFQKWRVHRRLRPEAFGGRVEVKRLGRRDYPIHPDLTTRSTVLPQILSRFGSHLLPQAFPEGSPLHPAYGSGHATVAGACVTMLKAFFDEDTVIQEPVMVDPNNPSQLTPYTGSDVLTVGGELNKLVSNVGQARNIAGVHWRTDAAEANRLGEQIAISILEDMAATYGEPFGGFHLTKFNGEKIVVG